MTHRNRSTGFTIVETMILIIFLAAIATVSVYAIKERATEQAKIAAANPTEVAGLKKSELDTMVARLNSNNTAKVALALGMQRTEVDPVLVRNFAKTTMKFDLKTTRATNNGAWEIEADIKDPEGKTSRWKVAILEGDDGLVFLDSAPVE